MKTKLKEKIKLKLKTNCNAISHLCIVFTARCTLVQITVLRSHVVCLSVTLVDCDHIS